MKGKRCLDYNIDGTRCTRDAMIQGLCTLHWRCKCRIENEKPEKKRLRKLASEHGLDDESAREIEKKL